MPPHRFERERHNGPCRVCGRYEKASLEDLNVLNFERHKWEVFVISIRCSFGSAWTDLSRKAAQMSQTPIEAL